MLIGLLGGTFDPVHNGHLHVAQSVLKQLPLDEVRLLPCFQPVHRPLPIASPEDRLAMLKLAIKNQDNITVDEHEIKRGGKSYMIDTLRELKKENPQHHYCLILGKDAFDGFHLWHEWQHISDFCHLIIVSRPHSNNKYPDTLISFVQRHQTRQISDLKATPSGKLLFINITPIDISATELRLQLSNKILDTTVIPDLVCRYIQEHHLYSAFPV